MTTTLNHLQNLLQNAAQQELLARFHAANQAAQTQQKSDGSLVTEADYAMQQNLENALQQHWPDIPLLGEESPPDQQQSLLDTAERLWILDPLDGTSNFAAGLPFFAVSLALLEAGEVRLGVIYDPLHQECFYAEKQQGAWLNGKRLQAKPPRTPLQQGIGLIDFKRLAPPLAQQLVSQPPYASQRSLGSVVLDWCWVAAGRVHVYLHGKQKLWDYAAASLILSEAGGHALSLDGEAVFQARLQPRSVAAALDADVFQQWCDYLGIARIKDTSQAHRQHQ